MATNDGALQGAPQGQVREVYKFKVPTKYRSDNCRESISIRKLRSTEEVDATRNCNGESMRLAWELAKMSLVLVDSKPVLRHEGEVESAWEKFDPKLRALIVAAYAKLNTPEDDETENFLGSMEIQVG